MTTPTECKQCPKKRPGERPILVQGGDTCRYCKGLK
jgi:hypothetical protein